MPRDYIGKNCPYCQTPIKPVDDVVVCTVCEQPHHRECWIENGGCTTFGCPGGISIDVEPTTTFHPGIFDDDDDNAHEPDPGREPRYERVFVQESRVSSQAWQGWALLGAILALIFITNSQLFGRGDVIAQHEASVRALCFSPDGSNVNSGDSNGELLTTEFPDAEHSISSIYTNRTTAAIACSDNQIYIASGYDDGIVKLMRASGRTEVWSRELSNTGISDLQFIPGSDTLVIVNNSGNISSINPSTTKVNWTWNSDSGTIYDIDISPNGMLIAGGSITGDAVIIDGNNGSGTMMLEVNGPGIRAVCFGIDGELLWLGDKDGNLTVLGVSERAFLLRPDGHTRSITCLALHPSGAVASGSDDEKVIIWDEETGNELKRFNVGSGVNAIDFSPDGQFLVTGDDKGRVMSWDVSDL